MNYVCECARRLIDMWLIPGGVMVECPVHGVHEYGERRELPARRFGRVP